MLGKNKKGVNVDVYHKGVLKKEDAKKIATFIFSVLKRKLNVNINS